MNDLHNSDKGEKEEQEKNESSNKYNEDKSQKNQNEKSNVIILLFQLVWYRQNQDLIWTCLYTTK